MISKTILPMNYIFFALTSIRCTNDIMVESCSKNEETTGVADPNPKVESKSIGSKIDKILQSEFESSTRRQEEQAPFNEYVHEHIHYGKEEVFHSMHMNAYSMLNLLTYQTAIKERTVDAKIMPLEYSDFNKKYCQIVHVGPEDNFGLLTNTEKYRPLLHKHEKSYFHRTIKRHPDLKNKLFETNITISLLRSFDYSEKLKFYSVMDSYDDSKPLCFRLMLSVICDKEDNVLGVCGYEEIGKRTNN